MFSRNILSALSLGSLFFTPALAVPVLFDLRDVSATTEIESGTMTRGGITATLTPFVQGGAGTLNQTATGFGINADATGDLTNQIDGAAGAESISLTFSTHVSFLALGVSQFGADLAGLQVAGFPEITINSTGVSQFPSDNLVPFGQAVHLRYISGSGFSFDSFTVELAEIARPPIPGPVTGVPDGGSTLALLITTFLGLTTIRRARKHFGTELA
jgi:hypothetical protein